MERLAAHRLKTALYTTGCVVWCAVLSLTMTVLTGSRVAGGCTLALLAALYVWVYLQTRSWKMLLTLSGYSLAPVALVSGVCQEEWVMVALGGLASVVAVFGYSSEFSFLRKAYREAREWEAQKREPAILPYPLSTPELVEHLRELAKANPDTMDLGKKGRHFSYVEETDDEDKGAWMMRTLFFQRQKDNWNACFYDSRTDSEHPCLPWRSLRLLYRRESATLEPSAQEDDNIPAQGVVFYRNGNLYLYPAEMETAFRNTWAKEFFLW